MDDHRQSDINKLEGFSGTSDVNELRRELKHANERLRFYAVKDLKTMEQVADYETQIGVLKDEILILKNDKLKYGKQRKLEKVWGEYKELEKICQLREKQFDKARKDMTEQMERDRKAFNLKEKELIQSKEELLRRASDEEKLRKKLELELAKERLKLNAKDFETTTQVTENEKKIEDLNVEINILKDDIYGKKCELKKVKDDNRELEKMCELREKQFNRDKNDMIEQMQRDKQVFNLEKKELIRSKEELLSRAPDVEKLRIELEHAKERLKVYAAKDFETTTRVTENEKKIEDLNVEINILKDDIYGKKCELKKVKDDNRELEKNSKLREKQFNRAKNDMIEQTERDKQALILEKKELMRSKEELLTRLSELVGSKIIQNPGIIDLSDSNRESKIAEQFIELYDTEWTDAFEELTSFGLSENEAIYVILDTVKTAYGFCCKLAEKYKARIFESPSQLPVLGVIQQSDPDMKVNPEIELSDEIRFQLEDIRKALSPLFCESVEKISLCILEDTLPKSITTAKGGSMDVDIKEDTKITFPNKLVSKTKSKKGDKENTGNKDIYETKMKGEEITDLIEENSEGAYLNFKTGKGTNDADRFGDGNLLGRGMYGRDSAFNVTRRENELPARTTRCEPLDKNEKKKSTPPLDEFEYKCVDLKMEEKFDINSYSKTCVFASKCARLCWLMRIKDPPLQLIWECTRGSEFNSDMFRHYTRSGKKTDFVVWPALLLHENGPLLGKGAAQAM